MTIEQLRRLPTSLSSAYMKAILERGSSGAHESLMRSYQLVQHVKGWLRDGTPPNVVLELIEHVEAALDPKEEPRP